MPIILGFFIVVILLTAIKIFLKITYYASFIMDIILIIAGGGYWAYNDIAPLIASKESLWIWTVIITVFFIFVYTFITYLVYKLSIRITKVFTFFISLFSASCYIIFMKLLVDTLYNDFVLHRKTWENLPHFPLTKFLWLDYTLWGIIALVYTLFVYKARMNFLCDNFTEEDDIYYDD